MPGSRQLGLEGSMLDEGLCPTNEHGIMGPADLFSSRSLSGGPALAYPWRHITYDCLEDLYLTIGCGGRYIYTPLAAPVLDIKEFRYVAVEPPCGSSKEMLRSQH